MRRIVEDDAKNFAQTMLNQLQHFEVIALEEEERERRIKEDSEQIKNHSVALDSDIQQEFMDRVHKKEVIQMEEEERNRRIEEGELCSAIESEIDRRVTWVLEEKERSRRILENTMIDFFEEMHRKIMKQQVFELEENERQRRIRAEKTHSNDSIQLSDQKDAIQREITSAANLKFTKQQEENERQIRIFREKEKEIQEQQNQKFESQLDLILVKRLEEKERNRRVSIDLNAQFESSLQSELARRKIFAQEEEERKQRILEGNFHDHNSSANKRAILRDINNINKQVNMKIPK